jgi:hypothetical protein
LLDGEGNVLGHLAVFDERPMPPAPRRLFIFRIFATRAAVCAIVNAASMRLKAIVFDLGLSPSSSRYAAGSGERGDGRWGRLFDPGG